MEEKNKEKETIASQQKTSSSAGDSKNIVAILSYFGILLIIPLLVAKEDEFVKYHVKQGIVLLIAFIIVFVVSIIPILGWLVGFFGWIIGLVLVIIGILNVVSGKKKELPIIGHFADKINL